MSPKRLPGTGFFLSTILLLLICASPARADEVLLKPDHPERYTVVKGDTLWGISSRFLKSPWYWPKIWNVNNQIKNPHLIYPGDVVVLRMVNGQPELSVLRKETVTAPAGEIATATPPAAAAAASGLPSLPESARSAEPSPGVTAPVDGRTVKLTPQAYSAPLESAIPTIQPDAILPFLTRPLIVGENELEQAGYVTTGLDDRIALGDGSQFYARGLKNDGPEYYQVIRPGKPIKNADTGEVLAYEALYLGSARRLETGDPSKLVVTEIKQEIIPTDRLLEAPKKASLPYYYPHAPKTQVEGRIVSALNAVAEIGPNAVVAITLGARDGIEEGHVLRVMRHAGKHKDPMTHERYKLPDEESGLVMVFRVFDKVSYALVMSATQPVHMQDAVITP
jgi:LysM repeat protein